MIFSESAEEVLEALWIAQETTKNFSMRLDDLKTESATISELSDKGIITLSEDKITLTEKGKPFAKDAIRRHRLAERLLTDVLAVKKTLIHETACQMEHHLHKGIDSNICTLLGHPKMCPHGKPIPAGKCCEEWTKEVAPAVSPLARVKPGDAGRVAYLHTQDPKRVQMLISMGIIPGTFIKLLASFPSFLFQLGEGQFAIDKELANEIYIRTA